MKIKVALFASARDLLGETELELELSDSATIGDLKRVLGEQFPKVTEILQRSAFSVDHEFALDETPIKPDSEVALIPPVSGG